MTAKRFTDVWCSETGHIGVTDNGIDKELTGSGFEDLLNELHDKYIDEYALRETLQLELQRVEEENKTLKTRLKEERELAMRLGSECDTLTIKKQELELEIIRLETIIKAGDLK